MKNLTLLFLALLICCQMQLSAQSCLPEGITFSTQEQIDNFQINYPGCTEIAGYVQIHNNISNLNGLSILTSIGGHLKIHFDNSLTNLSGLNNLSSIGEYLEINYCYDLTSLTGLENLVNIGGDLIISVNPSLTSLTGLENLSTIGGNLNILFNNGLINFTGLDNVTSIVGDLVIRENALTSLSGLGNQFNIGGDLTIWLNPSLTSLSGLNSLASIGGNLSIYENNALTSLIGLDNLDAGSISDLSICNNSSLSSCEIESICDYLYAPGGTVNIYNNANGCNNPGEIATNCGFTLPCLPFGNYYFLSQSEIDNFQSNYPGCTEIVGDVTISGDDINNLNGLNVVTSIMGNLLIKYNAALASLNGLSILTAIEGDLTILGNDSLTCLIGLENLTTIGGNLNIGEGYYAGYTGNPILNNLSGLDNLTFIGGSFGIVGNDSLLSLDGLNNLTSIGGDLKIGDSGNFGSYPSAISSLSGLENLTSIGGSLHLIGNSSLTNLTGLENISSISGMNIFGNAALVSLTGLENITSIGGELKMVYNTVLTDITGLKNIEPGSITDLSIYYNSALSDCDIWPICQYLSNTGATAEIHDNAPECNSIEEVQEHCLTEIDEYISADILNIYPNPLESTALIEYTLKNNSTVTLKILDLSGQEMAMLVNEVQQKGEQRVVFNTLCLKAGIYFCVLKTIEGVQTRKMIKL